MNVPYSKFQLKKSLVIEARADHAQCTNQVSLEKFQMLPRYLRKQVLKVDFDFYIRQLYYPCAIRA